MITIVVIISMMKIYHIIKILMFFLISFLQKEAIELRIFWKGTFHKDRKVSVLNSS